MTDQLKELNEYTKEAGRFYHLCTTQDKKDMDAINRLKNNSVLFNKEPSSNIAKVRFYDIKAFYYNAIGDIFKGLEQLEIFQKLLLEKMRNWSRFETRFVFLSFNLIESYIKTKQYEKAQKQLLFTQEFPLKSKLERDKVRIVLSHLQLRLNNETHQLKSLKNFVDKKEEVFWNKTLLDLSVDEETVAHFKIDYLISLLLLEKYTEALRWILECDNDKTFRTGDVNYQLVLLIEVILNYVLNDNETAQKTAKKHAKNKEFQLAHLFEALAISDKKKRDIALNEATKNSKENQSLLLEYFDVFDCIKTVLK